MGKNEDFFKYIQNIIDLYESNHHLEDVSSIYDENLFLKDYKVIENIRKYIGKSANEKENLKFQALQAQQVYIKALNNKINKVSQFPDLFYLLDKDEYDEEILYLKESQNDKYFEFEDYIIDIQCEINDLSKTIIAKVICDIDKREMLGQVLKKSIEYLNEIEIKEFEFYIKEIRERLINYLEVCIIEDVYRLYNPQILESNDIIYYRYLMKYRDEVNKFEFIEKETKNKITLRVQKDIMRIFEEAFVCKDDKTNLCFYCNNIIKIIMKNIIKVCSKDNFDRLKNKYEKNIDNLTIIIDLNKYKGSNFQIKDIHKKIFIYICHLVYKEKSQIVKFEFEDFLCITNKSKRDKSKIIEFIKQLNCIYFKEINETKLIDIVSENKNYMEIKINGEIFNERQNMLIAIDKNAFMFKEKGGTSTVGNEFTLILEMTMHMFFNKDNYKKRNTKGYFSITGRKILFDLLGYEKSKGNSFSFLQDKLYELQEEILSNSEWDIIIRDNINKKNFGSVLFKNEKLLLYKKKFT
ncbi:hypothetical protein [Clostridium butyricum]|uniref:hypothetical protein n=1 Tax=Clostridium butyricum TaxID=1492 RepID=UPI002AB313C4|nr:hypothetical protein [Clostridium butyricum]